MALSPGIPTSFVPKQPVQPVRRPMQSGTNIFLIVSLIIAGAIIAAAVGTFAYSKFLDQTLAKKQAQLTQAQSMVDENTVEEFVRLRDRLATAKELMSEHIVVSRFLDTLETITLQGVRFDDMKLSVAGDNTADLEMTGTAKSFNALAAQSNALAGEKRIKRAIFSDITVATTKLVTFKMTANIDPKLLMEGNEPLQPVDVNATVNANQQVPASTVSTTSPLTP